MRSIIIILLFISSIIVAQNSVSNLSTIDYQNISSFPYKIFYNSLCVNDTGFCNIKICTSKKYKVKIEIIKNTNNCKAYYNKRELSIGDKIEILYPDSLIKIVYKETENKYPFKGYIKFKIYQDKKCKDFEINCYSYYKIISNENNKYDRKNPLILNQNDDCDYDRMICIIPDYRNVVNIPIGETLDLFKINSTLIFIKQYDFEMLENFEIDFTDFEIGDYVLEYYTYSSKSRKLNQIYLKIIN